MRDSALKLLLENRQPGTATLWLADENILDEPVLKTGELWQPKVVSNRINICGKFEALNYVTDFSDFDLSSIEDSSVSAVHYRVSKEKALVHYLINQSYRILVDGGKIIISGLKKEGIKTYIDKTVRLFAGDVVKLREKPDTFCAVISKHYQTGAELLEDKQYTQIRKIGAQNNIDFYSKPGVFGWDKIDKGSAFLVEHLADFLSSVSSKETLLDLGCGYGYLALMASQHGISHITASDNNAAALLCCDYNFCHNNITAISLVDDCGANINNQFDIILCNPPFHQGFSMDGMLTNQFLTNTKRLLSRKGSALFVVNAFIPLERKAQQIFDRIETIAENKSFKLIKLANS